MSDFKISFSVGQTPLQVFEAVNNVAAWWGPVEGNTTHIGDEFIYRHGDIHYSRHRVAEMVSGQKVVWLTVDSRLNFVQQKDEWNDTKIIFEISENEGLTTLNFTQQGLTPALECYGGCSGAWGFYVGESLRELIVTGKGQPD